MEEREFGAALHLGPDGENLTIATDLGADQAGRQIERAVSGRQKVARKYVRRLRRRHPEATPTELITLLERHYITAISVAGAVITVGTVALEVGISLIPGGGAATAGTKAAAKKAGGTAVKQATKQAAKLAGKQAAVEVAKTGARKVVALIPAGDEQLQFEVTALFALALADIHGFDLDQQQAHALVYGLSNDRVSQAQIANMANDLAETSKAGPAGIGHTIADGRHDWSHWANTLADALPGTAAQDLVRGVQTGVLEDVRGGLEAKQQAAVEYGVGALVGGVTRFVFGREVVEAAREAFALAPATFPDHLEIPTAPEKLPQEPNRALEALEDAAKTVGAGLSVSASAVGTGAAAAAGAVTRPFRSVDLDGDGVLDEPRAVTAVKGVGAAASGAARRFRRVDLDGDGVPDEPQALTTVKGVGKAVATSIKPKGRRRHEPGGLTEASNGHSAMSDDHESGAEAPLDRQGES